jgi:hypothetical protein
MLTYFLRNFLFLVSKIEVYAKVGKVTLKSNINEALSVNLFKKVTVKQRLTMILIRKVTPMKR